MKLKEGYTQDDLIRLIREGVSAGLDALDKPAEEPEQYYGGHKEEVDFIPETSEDEFDFDMDEIEEDEGEPEVYEDEVKEPEIDWSDHEVETPKPVTEESVKPGDIPLKPLDFDVVQNAGFTEGGSSSQEEADIFEPTVPEPVVEEQPKLNRRQKLAKIIRFRKREEIPETGEFFDLTEDEKFHTVEEAIKANTEAFQRKIELEELAKDVSSAVGDRLNMYFNKGVHEGKKKAYNSSKSDRHTKDRAIFTNDTLDIGGKAVKYTRHTEVPKWNMDLLECVTTDDKALNFEQVRRKITEEFINYFGGLGRIQTIYVQSYQLIINGVCYVPKLSKQVLLRLPFDCADYLLNGCVAPFFNWGYIYKMPHLNTLAFDDLDFVMSYVADDSGRGRDFKPMLMFKYIPNLSTLIIGQEVIQYPFENEETAESVENIEREVKRSNYFTSACDRYYNKTFEVTKSLRKWGVSNLTNYAKNRGNKGFFKYAGGVVVRAAGSVMFAAPEAVTRIGGGIIKGLSRAIKETTEGAKTKG